MTRHDKRFVEDVRAHIGLVDLIGGDVALKRAGREHTGLCPFHSEKTPSFTVNEDKGFFHCFGCGAHGDAFAWIMMRTDCDFPTAVRELAIRVGLAPDETGQTRPKPKPVAPAKQGGLSTGKASSGEYAQRLWRESRPATGTLVETYLASRGVRAEQLGVIPVSIRFHPAIWHSDDKVELPGMVAAVQDEFGKIRGVHRTYLRRDGAGKAAVSKPKKMAGLIGGGAIRLASAGLWLGVAEGVETALSVMASTGRPVWAAGSLGNMAAVSLPSMARDIVLCADNDSNPEALKEALEKAKAFYRQSGRRVRVVYPPRGMDFNDLLIAQGPGAVRAAVLGGL